MNTEEFKSKERMKMYGDIKDIPLLKNTFINYYKDKGIKLGIPELDICAEYMGKKK